REIIRFHRTADPVVEYTPQPVGNDPQRSGYLVHRHLVFDQQHRKSFEQQRESAARAGPWHHYRLHRTIALLYPGNTGMKEPVVLKKVQVLPAPVFRIVNAAHCTRGIRKLSPWLKIKVDVQLTAVQPFGLGQFCFLYIPWGFKPKGHLEYLIAVHDTKLKDFMPPAGARRAGRLDRK